MDILTRPGKVVELSDTSLGVTPIKDHVHACERTIMQKVRENGRIKTKRSKRHVDCAT